MFSRRTTLAAIASMALAGSLSAQDLDEIRMGYIADYFGTSIAAIATDQGLWEKHSLDADLKVFTNGPIQVQALNAGSLDFAYIGPGALWLPASGQAKVIAPNALGYTDRVIAQPGIDSIQDLKGKKVGVPEGTSGDMLLRLALADAGMSLDDIDVVTMDPSTVVTAFSSGQIDAAGIWYPFVDVVRQRVPDLNELSSNEEFFPEIAFPSSFIVSDDMAGNEDVIRKVIAVIKEANDFRVENREQSVSITAEFLNVSEEPLLAESQLARLPTSAEYEELSRGGQVANWFGTLADLYAQFGKIENPLPASEFYLGALYAE
ncbi:aliphatic sulfonate ABC transporter substrate-binding protein [Salipiger aestuarii]|uniref:NitT/TauT family transport system substrate-binding protein n=1 Tax=Salipiger aestuarii TaxID=568098 RepID=A0A327XP92_9RHOB|nr:aliphatic sulfonate ABC transporter substrate-binding protein [Salipiger aestuarii]KAA8606385.1 bicyclomycin resistance protein [Salipiger aestuarii]KAB2532298.1 bicyclomycin resistance protein [Salipiger aestuarii]RAK07819.1 NitT/TauT family transport system substrate-binding protein [Salipiger aestuarii]